MTNFLSAKNKEFIWDFLLENRMFDGIDPRFKSGIEADLNKVITLVSSLPTFTNLVDKNREVLRLITAKLTNYKQGQAQPQIQAQSQAQAKTQGQSQAEQQPPLLYKSEVLQTERQKQMEQQFKTKQEEMNNMLIGKKPSNVKFTDDPDKPIGGEMDKLIEQALAMRKQQLNQVLEKQDTNQAAKWIGNDSAIRNIKIGDDTELKDHQIVSLPLPPPVNASDKKQVSFNPEDNRTIEFAVDEETESFNTSTFLSRLKKTIPQKEEQNDNEEHPSQERELNIQIKELKLELNEVNKKLDLILSQQIKIIEMSRPTIDNIENIINNDI